MAKLSCASRPRTRQHSAAMAGLALALASSWLVLTALSQVPQQPSAASAAPENKPPPNEAASALPRGKKLVLKDGTFQIVRNYERKGDRVRFYSVERSEWEELPADLVDWEATRAAEVEQALQEKELEQKMKAAQAAERAADIEAGTSILVAPGVFLPDNEGLYLIDGKIVLPMNQNTATVKLDKGRLLTQVLVPVPVVPSRHRVQLPGKKAELRIANAQPEFYFRTADAREPEVELIRAEVKGNARLLEFISTNIVGQQSSKRNSLSMQRWDVAKGVYRFTLGEPLPPGEYALAEILPEGMNLYVWDFGVDSPANKSTPARKPPAQAKPKQ